MLFVTIVPLFVHIYSIDNYSDFVIENDRENTKDITRAIITSWVVGQQKDSAVFVSDIISNSQIFNRFIQSRNQKALEIYFSELMSDDIIKKNIINIVGLAVYSEDNQLIGQYNVTNFVPETIYGILDNHADKAGSLRNLADGYYRASVNEEPHYLLVYPLEATDYKHKLVVVTTVWESLTGLAQLLQADLQVHGNNGELFFTEKYINNDGNLQNTDGVNPTKVTLEYGENGNFIDVSVFTSNTGILAKSDDLKSMSILVTASCMLLVLVIGAYILNKGLFSRIESFSRAMKNIVEGKPNPDISVKSNDEFTVLTEQLERVIEYNHERTRIKEDLESAMEQAEVANVAKSDFLANMSHELRTPLNAIIGFSELLANDELESYSRDKTREYATDINDSGKHLLSIINDILDLSKVEAGKMSFYEDEIDLVEICETSLRVLSNQAREKSLDVSLDADERFPLIKADERMMQQMLTNILSNAVKFSLDGGDIKIVIKVSSSGDVIISVTDNGIGIAQNKLEDIMEPFHQVETSYAKTEVGTGLGLSLVKAFVELHDGKIKIESELGKRTTVFVCFPGSRIISSDEDSFCSLDYKSAGTV